MRGEGVYGGGLDWTLEAGAVYFSNLLAALLLGNLGKKRKKNVMPFFYCSLVMCRAELVAVFCCLAVTTAVVFI